MNQKNPPQLIIFDLDGTLVNSLPDIANAVNETLADYQRAPLELDSVREKVGDGPRKLIERAFPDIAPDAIDSIIQRYLDIYEKHSGRVATLMPGVQELLDRLKDRTLAVVTNKVTRFAIDNLEKVGIADRFSAILGFDCGLPVKPAPDCLLHIAAAKKIKASACAMIGDGLPDVRAGKAAGMLTCAILGGFGTPEELKKLEPDIAVQTIDELIPVLCPGVDRM
ncbi:MAG: HAD-IA family hydrolase [Planctomycetota bacterium]